MSESDTAGAVIRKQHESSGGKKAGDDYETPHPEGITSHLLFLHRIRDLQRKDRNMYLMRPVQEPCRGIQDQRAEVYTRSRMQSTVRRKRNSVNRQQEKKMNNLPSDTQENGQKVHQIKLGATFFEEVAYGNKTFELRKNDRGYKKGDILEMMEFAGRKKHRTHSRECL